MRTRSSSGRCSTFSWGLGGGCRHGVLLSTWSDLFVNPFVCNCNPYALLSSNSALIRQQPRDQRSQIDYLCKQQQQQQRRLDAHFKFEPTPAGQVVMLRICDHGVTAPVLYHGTTVSSDDRRTDLLRFRCGGDDGSKKKGARSAVLPKEYNNRSSHVEG